MNLSSISHINKELGAGGIHRKQEHDFYISSSGKGLMHQVFTREIKDTKIRKIRQIMYVNNQIQQSKRVVFDVHINLQINAKKNS